ncbi:S-4TM family putative pore-forming effector [Xanthomonas nasturtii]|uniref:S-4TM family putative pore-forming effector n=1 Tax=Xanthomonas nasturtii TaxID=1843581 RepID=UPI002B22C34B|nr:S-4TM family putative pore-forming effector [Xanthomonas nasturtii]MEA9579934.1 S-4TM family putative pore-forming effector [Xanthomonas nasturtii]
MEELSNEIVSRQNEAEMVTLLWARKQIYKRVKLVQGFYFAFTFALPSASLMVALHYEEYKPWMSLLAIAIGAADAIFFDVWRKKKIKLAARLQEQFDCYVLGMKWNSFVAGARVSPQDVEDYAAATMDAEMKKNLENWYPKQSCAMPLPAARLVCQRTNLWYDSNLRTTYRTALWCLTSVYFVALLVFFRDSALIALLLGLLIPFGPLFTWVVREHHRQGDTIKLVCRLLSEIDKSLEDLVDVKQNSKAEARARELQDAIFTHRSSSPLVSDLIYKLKRPKLEKTMQKGAEAFVQRIGKLIGK